MIILDLFKSKRFLINLFIAIIVLVFSVAGTIFGIDIYTDNGNEITIPSLIGMSEEQANNELKDLNLEVEIIDSIYSKEVEKGTIVEQTPKAENKIKENRKIYVIINAFSNEVISMPDLVGVSIRQAINDAKNFGVVIGERKYVPDIAKNYVLRQYYRGKIIKPGEKVPKGSYIDLEIGQGSSDEKILVPNILGLNIKNAEAKCSDLFLNISGIFYSDDIKTKEDTANAIIYKQSPMPTNNNKTVVGSFIDVWLSTDSSLVPEIKTDTLINIDNIDEESTL